MFVIAQYLLLTSDYFIDYLLEYPKIIFPAKIIIMLSKQVD